MHISTEDRAGHRVEGRRSRRWTATLATTTLLAVGASVAISGGTFDLSWFTIDGGGGRSAGGAFELAGTTGQPDAGTLLGGPFTLGGGFWRGGVPATTPVEEPPGTESPDPGVPGTMPTVFRSYAAFPNPFNPSTTVRWDLPATTDVKIEVFDAGGRLVAVLVDAQMPAGRYDVRWDGRDATGVGVASGVYLVRTRAGDEVRRQKVTLLQ